MQSFFLFFLYKIRDIKIDLPDSLKTTKMQISSPSRIYATLQQVSSASLSIQEGSCGRHTSGVRCAGLKTHNVDLLERLFQIFHLFAIKTETLYLENMITCLVTGEKNQTGRKQRGWKTLRVKQM